MEVQESEEYLPKRVVIAVVFLGVGGGGGQHTVRP